MMRGQASRWWQVAGLAVALASMVVGDAAAATVDPEASWAGFTLKTRWGQTLEGRFPVMTGEIVPAGDRRRVQLRLSTRDVEIVGSTRYSRLTRGEGFFDAENHPQVVFVSDAYQASLVRDGGQLAGQLTIRGTTRREVFTVEPSVCDRPGLDCDVVASGYVYRGDFAMDRWAFALSDRVRLVMRLRTQHGGA
jgi:polyisoprenoid-binding protein YceI